MLKRILLFLIINFTALAIGGLFTKTGVNSDWYANLNKAPWTPPGYLFGIAWSTIMICFAIYMAKLCPKYNNKKAIVTLFIFQWILNASWNPIFFYLHQTIAGLITITALTIVVTYFLFNNLKRLQYSSLFIAPYFIWLLIATSLNAYIVFMN
ncbi:tryptophan-rich sensory protein [Wenyingzhuangia heitensis]|uniref:Tryptophan-rich sensory protein n=1 Tax=Wenyingzhuangia heitensis TaxID=1487859 RepID=A0ABX0U960_9FLAO|nr:TspO/MBR family protein [Wenyingzhuangia heitensis]NIJ44748.1 tryptophan-rich sensory protein [Wenyingzhuangia heitensis]